MKRGQFIKVTNFGNSREIVERRGFPVEIGRKISKAYKKILEFRGTP